MDLKNVLLSTGCIDDNIWLQKYTDLVESNRTTQRTKYSTQKHHVIPVAYYKHILKTDVNNSKENIVHLLYSDHILAHYYLSQCAVGDLQYYAMYGLFVLLNMKEYNNEADLLVDLPNYQKLYEEFRKRYAKELHDQLYGNKKGNGHSGKKYMHKDSVCVCISPDKFDEYIANGYVFGRLTSDSARANIRKGQQGTTRLTLRGVPKSEEHKRKIADKIAGRVRLTDGCRRKLVYPDSIEYQQLVSEGWRVETTADSIQRTVAGRICVHRETTIKVISKQQLSEFLAQGYELGRGSVNTRGTTK